MKFRGKIPRACRGRGGNISSMNKKETGNGREEKWNNLKSDEQQQRARGGGNI